MHSNCRKILRRIVRDFQTKHHGLVSQFDEHKVSVIELAFPESGGIPQGLAKHPPLEDTLWELVQLGYLKDSGEGSVSLTERGLREGSRNCAQHIWDFIDRSPGVAVCLAFLALLVSIVALLKG